MRVFRPYTVSARLSHLLVLVLALAAAAPAAAEECVRSWQLSVDLPRAGARVPPDARPRVRIHEGCAAFQGGPRPEVRLVTAAAVPVATAPAALPRWFVELVPARPLAPGRYRVEGRRTASPERLGPWEALVSFAVTGAAEERAPGFAGIDSAAAVIVEGTVFLSPCQAERGPLVRTRLAFARARHARPHAELLYSLEGRRDGAGAWQVLDDLRPPPGAAGARASFEWTSQRNYGETWEYRLRVRDHAGREATGARTATVRNPPAPPARPRPQAGRRRGGRAPTRPRPRRGGGAAPIATAERHGAVAHGATGPGARTCIPRERDIPSLVDSWRWVRDRARECRSGAA
ncbi:MAG TPA: hypothetical protein VGQ83_05845 [Polyangia bacterium]|jgi:hypothetical protein